MNDSSLIPVLVKILFLEARLESIVAKLGDDWPNFKDDLLFLLGLGLKTNDPEYLLEVINTILSKGSESKASDVFVEISSKNSLSDVPDIIEETPTFTIDDIKREITSLEYSIRKADFEKNEERRARAVKKRADTKKRVHSRRKDRRDRRWEEEPAYSYTEISRRSLDYERNKQANGGDEEKDFEDGAEEKFEQANYVNFGFSDVSDPNDPKPLDLYEGLLANHEYKLSVGIGLTPDIRFGGSQDQPEIERPEKEEPIDLFVAVFLPRRGPLKLINDPLDTITWPIQGPSTKNAEFVFETTGLDAAINSSLDIYIYFKKFLLYTARFSITIQPEDYKWDTEERPIRWLYEDKDEEKLLALFPRFASLKSIRERGLNLAIQKSPYENEYSITAFIGEAVMPARVTLSTEKLNSNLIKMRQEMDRLRKSRLYLEAGYNEKGEYVGDYRSKSGGYDKYRQQLKKSIFVDVHKTFLRRMANLGNQFYIELFGTESGLILRQAIEDHLHTGDIIQIWIDRDANDFVYPWAWLYTETFDISKRYHPSKEKFWGYEYIIEQLPQFRERAGKAHPGVEIPSDPVDIKIGVYNFEPTTKTQKNYFAERNQQSGGKLVFDIWDKDTLWEEYLPSCSSDILYFFSHGHTAKPASIPSSQFFDMTESWKSWLDQKEADESDILHQYRKRAAEFLSDLEKRLEFSIDETFIRLQDGYLWMRELKEKVNLETSAPLVFLNMCESAQIFPSLSDGLIDIFLKRGARGVIGTEIPMIDSFADLFAREFFHLLFYQRIDINGDETPIPVGETLYELRRKFLDLENPLGFAYTMYGDATIHLERSLPGLIS